MQKTRTQLRESIAKGKAFLEREDITPKERELAEQKLDRYYVELAFLPDEEEEFPADPFDLEPDTTPVPEPQVHEDPSLIYREMIRSKLQPIKEGVKRRA